MRQAKNLLSIHFPNGQTQLKELSIENILLANTYWLKLSGYMFRKTAHCPGILFLSSGGIHTSFMNFNLDVIFLSQDNQILKITRKVQPWRLVFSPAKSKKILELPAGQLPADIQLGAILRIEQR